MFTFAPTELREESTDLADYRRDHLPLPLHLPQPFPSESSASSNPTTTERGAT